MNPQTYKNQFYILTKYIKDNYFVDVIQKPYAEDAWYPQLKLIRINQNLKYRERLFTLLHEAGHMIIDTRIKHKGVICFNKNMPWSVRSKKGFVHLMNEEILAWNYGKELAEHLNFSYGKENLDDYMSDCIMSHVRNGLNCLYGSEINANIIYTKRV